MDLLTKQYLLAKSLLKFKRAYEELVEASKEMPDYDISENYPFYLLDFEAIGPAVSQWCITHYDKLISDVPVNAPSPAITKTEEPIVPELPKDYRKSVEKTKIYNRIKHRDH